MRVKMKDWAGTTAKEMMILFERTLRNSEGTGPVKKKMGNRT
jgi:hypothetical protein